MSPFSDDFLVHRARGTQGRPGFNNIGGGGGGGCDGSSGPCIDTVSALTHGASATITGAGYGTKSTAAPTVWDDCSGTNILSLWSGYWPNAGPAQYQMAYTTADGSVAMPHSRISKYMTGAHGGSGGNNAGDNVMAWKTYSLSGFPYKTYMSWYYHEHPSWVESNNGCPAACDDNNKRWEYGDGTEPYVNQYYYADIHVNRPSATSVFWGVANDTGSTGPGNFGNNEIVALAPRNGWIKYEVLGHWRKDATQGYFGLKEYKAGVGQQIAVEWGGVGSDGITDTTTRTQAFGGFERIINTANERRYFADIYFDLSWARVVIGDASTYTACSILETQIPSAWSANSITITANLGALSAGTVYVYVIDSNGTISAGKAVTI